MCPSVNMVVVADVNKFELDKRVGTEHVGEIIPPPMFTNHSVPFNWGWEQNPHIFRETDELTGNKVLINHSANVSHTANYLPRDAPTIPTHGPAVMPTEPALLSLIAALEELFADRPLWTRRGLMNRLGHLPSFYLLRNALPHIGYMFKGGPFRDAIIKYGIDPRSDPKYRKYQTMFYKMFSADDNKQAGDAWEDLRTTNRIIRPGDILHADTHLFDGVNLTLDGKVWQVCDVSDPLLVHLIETAPIRETCDKAVDGWFTNGRLAKIKAVMKVKLIAIRTSKTVQNDDFKDALSVDDVHPNKNHRDIHIPVPDLRLTEEEIKNLEDKGVDLSSMGITMLRRTDQLRKLHAKKARGTKPVQKRGKYVRKEKKALLEMGVDNAMEKLQEIKDKKNKSSSASRARGGRGVGATPKESEFRKLAPAQAGGTSTPTDGSMLETIENSGQPGPAIGASSPVNFDRLEPANSEDDQDKDEPATSPIGGGYVDEEDDGDSDGTDDADFTLYGNTPQKLPPSSGFAAARM